MYLSLTFNRIRMAVSHNPRQSKIVFINRRLFALIGAIITALLGVTVYARDGGTSGSVFPNPGLTNPRMKFNTGKVVKGTPQFSPLLPNIRGPLSGWCVWMAHRSEYLNGSEMVRNDEKLKDARFGPAAYAFIAPNHNSRLAIYRNHTAHRWVYDLFERNGPLDPDGGANLFLMANARSGHFTMNHPVVYNLRAKISQAHIRYYNSSAEKSGAVLAQVFSGFILKFHSRNPRQRITLFMQIHMADSRPWMGTTGEITDEQCTWNPAGAVLIADLAPPGGYPFHFRPDGGPLHHLHYLLNGFLSKILAAPPPLCRRTDGSVHHLKFTNRMKNLKNWTLNSMYVGLETENRDYRPGVRDHQPQGTVSVGLQVSDLSVVSEVARPGRHLPE
jgi:hypothetical protein